MGHCLAGPPFIAGGERRFTISAVIAGLAAGLIFCATTARAADPGYQPWNGGDHVVDGTTTAKLDGKALFTTVARSFRDPFTGFTLINRGGDYMLRAIRIDGTT